MWIVEPQYTRLVKTTVKMNKTSDITCFNCYIVGHRKSECPSLKQGGLHTAAAVQLITHNHTRVYKTDPLEELKVEHPVHLEVTWTMKIVQTVEDMEILH